MRHWAINSDASEFVTIRDPRPESLGSWSLPVQPYENPLRNSRIIKAVARGETYRSTASAHGVTAETASRVIRRFVRGSFSFGTISSFAGVSYRGNPYRNYLSFCRTAPGIVARHVRNCLLIGLGVPSRFRCEPMVYADWLDDMNQFQKATIVRRAFGE